MSKNLNETIGTVGFDKLISAGYPAADVFSVTIAKGAAAQSLKRGTILAFSSGTAGTGKMSILGTTAVTNETLTANCVLAEDTEVGTAADVTALAYRTGQFNRNAVIVKDGYTFTAADEQELRKAGVLLSDSLSY